MNPSIRARSAAAVAIVVCVVTLAAYRSTRQVDANAENGMFAPTVTATKTVAEVTGLSNGDGNADPGETLEYTITINNTAPPGAGNDATGVSLADTLQNITSLVPGSAIAAPIAVNDSFSALGNVSITVPLANSV